MSDQIAFGDDIETLGRLDRALAEARAEVAQASKNWPPFNSAHEGWAVLIEEYHELIQYVYMN